MGALIALSVLAVAATAPARAAGAAVNIVADDTTLSLDRDTLLARPDVVEITVAHDIAYAARMVYRAVPLAALVSARSAAERVLEIEAKDGFVAQVPLELVGNRDRRQAVTYLAIEPADKPWPVVPGKDESAGPFYVVWVGERAASVPALDWPYQVTRMTIADAPAKRWPALAVDATLPALDPARAGQSLFIANCFTCHGLNGAGPASVGPDLNLPMNPTEYLTEAGLRKLIRDPRTLRTWPDQRMPGFTPEQLSDQDIGLVIEYLKHMAGRKTRPKNGDAAK